MTAEVDQATAERLTEAARRIFGRILKELADLDSPRRILLGDEGAPAWNRPPPTRRRRRGIVRPHVALPIVEGRSVVAATTSDKPTLTRCERRLLGLVGRGRRRRKWRPI